MHRTTGLWLNPFQAVVQGGQENKTGHDPVRGEESGRREEKSKSGGTGLTGSMDMMEPSVLKINMGRAMEVGASTHLFPPRLSVRHPPLTITSEHMGIEGGP